MSDQDSALLCFLREEVLCSVCSTASTAKRFFCPDGRHHVCQDCVVLKFKHLNNSSNNVVVCGSYPHCPDCTATRLAKNSSAIISLPGEAVLNFLCRRSDNESIMAASPCHQCGESSSTDGASFECMGGHSICLNCVLALSGFTCRLCDSLMKLAPSLNNNGSSSHNGCCFMLGCDDDGRDQQLSFWDHLERRHLVKGGKAVPDVSKAGIILPATNGAVITFTDGDECHGNGKVSVGHHLSFDGHDFLVLSRAEREDDREHCLVSVVMLADGGADQEEFQDRYKVTMLDEEGEEVYDGPVNSLRHQQSSSNKDGGDFFRHRADRVLRRKNNNKEDQDRLRLRIRVRRDLDNGDDQVFKFWHHRH